MRRCIPIPPVVPPVSKFPRCAKPRKSVITVNGLSPDANGNVNAGDVRREDFSGVEPKEKMTLNEVGAKVNEVIGRLGGAADAAAASPRASGYGPGTPLGDVHPDTALRDVVEASGMSADGVRAIASEVVAPVAASVTDLRTSKLDKADVVDPAAATEDGKAADAKKTKEELDRILGVASGAMALAESKADKLSSRQLEAVNSGIDAGKVAKIAQNESAISAEVSRATTEEARLRELVNAIKTFDAVVADSLPSPSEQYRKKLYLVPSTNPETRNVKDEFICVNIADAWSWEQVGSTAITIEFDDEPTEGSQKAARSGGIWSWVKSLLPSWLTSTYAEPATVESVAKKADKATPVTDGNLAVLTADGGIKDSLMNPRDFARTYELDGYLPLTGGVVNGVQIGVIASGYASMNRVFSFGSPRIDLYEEYNLLERFSGIKWYYGESEDPANEIAVKGDISALSSSVSGLASSVSGLSSSKADKSTTYTKAETDEKLEKKMDNNDGPVSVGTGWGLSVNDIPFLFYEQGDFVFNGKLAGAAGDALNDKANLCQPSASGNLASLTADGNLADSSIDGLGVARMYGDDLVVQPGGTTTRVNASMLGYSNSGSDTIKDRLDAKADRASIAPQYSATSAYSVGSIVYHDGNIYQCKTAIAGGGEAWNADHWELRKLDDFFTESNSLLTGTIAAKSIPAFSSSSTYETGEIVIHDGVAYKCVTAITTAEEWTAAHWTLATNSDLSARLKGLKSDGMATDAFATDLLGKQVAKEAVRYAFDSPTSSTTTTGTVETTAVTANSNTVASVTIPAAASGNTPSLAITVPDALGPSDVRDLIVYAVNADTTNDCPIGIVGGTPVPQDGAEAKVPKGSRVYIAISKMPTTGEWFIQAVKLTAAA